MAFHRLGPPHDIWLPTAEEARAWIRSLPAGILASERRLAAIAGVTMLVVGLLGLATTGGTSAARVPRQVASTQVSAPAIEQPMAPARTSAPTAPVLAVGDRGPTPLLPATPKVDEKQVWTAPVASAPPPAPPPRRQALPQPRRTDNSIAGAFRNFQRDLGRLFR